MTDIKILEGAIKKAAKNGYGINSPTYIKNKADSIFHSTQDYELIFSHDFAKAFWGSEIVTVNYPVKDSFGKWLTDGDPSDLEREMESWAYHLQQMVLEEEPLKYLEKFI